jgi:hypothetical protein
VLTTSSIEPLHIVENVETGQTQCSEGASDDRACPTGAALTVDDHTSAQKDLRLDRRDDLSENNPFFGRLIRILTTAKVLELGRAEKIEGFRIVKGSFMG